MTLRRKPYVDVTRAKCHMCGKPATESFHARACALGPTYWVALCGGCDMRVNSFIVREVLRLPNANAILNKYREATR